MNLIKDLLEVVRPSDRAAERAKAEAKEAALKKRVTSAYTRALTAPQYKPHASDVGHWLFGGGPADTDAMKDLAVWTDAIGHMVGVTPSESPSSDEKAFKVLSRHLDVDGDLIDVVCKHRRGEKITEVLNAGEEKPMSPAEQASARQTKIQALTKKLQDLRKEITMTNKMISDLRAGKVVEET